MLNEWKLSDYVSINSLERDGLIQGKKKERIQVRSFFCSNSKNS